MLTVADWLAAVVPADSALSREHVRRFWRRVLFPPIDGCWVWLGRPCTGYGRASIGQRRTILAHRFASRIAHGPLNDEVCVLHSCDNRICVRPAHLFRGDRESNAQDMAAKGRQFLQQQPDRVLRGDDHWSRRQPDRVSRGERNGNARLTEPQVREMRRRWAAGETKAELRRRFGVGYCAITGIVDGTTWRHVASTISAPTHKEARS